MHQGDSAVIVLVLQIQIELSQLLHQEHALIDDGTGGKACHIGVVAGLLEHPPGNVQLAVESKALLRPLGALHEGLLDAGHFGKSLVAQSARIHRDGAPAKEAHPLFFHDDLEHLLGLQALQGVLREKEHADAVVPLSLQRDPAFPGCFFEKVVGDLQQNADAVAGLPLGVLTGAVLQLFHDLQRIVHRLMGLCAVDVHHGADAAVIMFKGRIV